MIEWIVGIIAVIAVALAIAVLFREFRKNFNPPIQQPTATQTVADLRRARLEAARRSREDLAKRLEEEEELLELEEDIKYYREEIKKARETRRARRQKSTQSP